MKFQLRGGGMILECVWLFVLECGLCHIIVQQMLKKIIISFCLLRWAASIGNLTFNNCPSNFSVANFNSTLALANHNLAVSLYSNVFSSELQVNVTNSLVQGNLYPMIKTFTSTSFLLPYIMVGSVFGLLYCVTVCCCTFERRCPPCRSWRRNYLKDPYSGCERRVTMFFTVFFATGVVVATIVVFSSFSLLRQDLAMFKCSLYYALDAATSGNQAANWGGFGQVQSQVSSITSLLNSTASAVSSQLAGNNWIMSDYTDMQNMNLDLWNNYQSSKVLSPDPVGTQAAMGAGTSLPTVVPRFVLSGLGPNGTAGAMVTDIDSGLRNTQKVTVQAETTYQSAMTFANSVGNISANTNSNLQAITIVTTQLGQAKVGIDAFVGSYVAFASGTLIYAVQALFGLILLASLITLFGAISTHVFDIFGCKRMVVSGWGLLGLQYFGVLVVLIGFLVVGGVSYVFCQYFGSVIANPTVFSSYSLQTGANSYNHLFQYMDVCFFGDGDILRKFGLSNEMGTVAELFDNVQTYLNMQTVGNAQYVSLAASPTRILGWMTAMTKYGQGVYNDAAPGVVDESDPYNALNGLNLRTLASNSTGVNTTCANDFWVFDATNCTNGATEALYTPSNDNTNGLYFPPTGSLCIPLNTRISNNAPSIWSAADIAQRYLSVRSCKVNSSEAYSQIVHYAESLTNYRDSRLNLYQSFYDELNALLVANNNYNNKMNAFTSSLNTFFSSVSAINNLVNNQINGLTISNNCTAVADGFRFFYNMYCVNFVNRSVKISISCLILLVLIVGSIISGSLFGVRFGRIEKQRRLTAVEVQTEVLKEQGGVSQQSQGENSSQQQQHN